MIVEDVRAAARSVLRARGLTFVLLLSGLLIVLGRHDAPSEHDVSKG